MHPDRRYEKWLQSERVAFEQYPAFPLELIDLPKSLHNQARLDVAINLTKTAEYTRLIKEGRAEFPPILVCRPSEWKNGKWLIITGNHRVQAALDAGLAHFDAYHVTTADTDTYVRDLLIRSANVVEGDTITASERVSQAIYLVRTYNRSVREVADALHLSASSITERMRSDRTKERLAGQGLTAERLGKGILARLDAIQSDVVLKETAELIQKARLSLEATTQVIQTVTQLGSEDKQRSFIAQRAEDPAYQLNSRESRGGKLKPRGPRWALFIHLSTVSSLIATHGTNLKKLGITDAASYQRFCDYTDHLTRTFGELRRQGPPSLPVTTPPEAETPEMDRVAASHGARPSA